MSLVDHELIQKDVKDMIASGVVITGGSSLLPGLIEVAEQIFGLPTRIGYTRGVGGLSDVIRNPMYATAVGLTKYGFKLQGGTEFYNSKKHSIWQRFIEGIKIWFKEAF